MKIIILIILIACNLLANYSSDFNLEGGVQLTLVRSDAGDVKIFYKKDQQVSLFWNYPRIGYMFPNSSTPYDFGDFDTISDAKIHDKFINVALYNSYRDVLWLQSTNPPGDVVDLFLFSFNSDNKSDAPTLSFLNSSEIEVKNQLKQLHILSKDSSNFLYLDGNVLFKGTPYEGGIRAKINNVSVQLSQLFYLNPLYVNQGQSPKLQSERQSNPKILSDSINTSKGPKYANSESSTNSDKGRESFVLFVIYFMGACLFILCVIFVVRNYRQRIN